ncbi:hypothetical protein TVAG_206840 [Trichomonas vaginalis G3]|uniref:Uncharacterized protein n=1 Tax=Trichomonas vaginalis (strain ATCC PRA-98 / G3) TaxID=412133 RepID=A2EY62_TRIV3|nr:hypothetical protein TVAGG3_0413630 [Trichomonas vaginalis G3]EAY02408.1 hypothetical protein TVAG_206840 [Trichomonas vaginalis G3]KAI5535527.1 hypothetical protein TVAGG3_0413630 [Trichomonas vaginalis G3]|eukprot:XP_001330661.1 hypothetical protein [Trichomonas vaginalis G3]
MPSINTNSGKPHAVPTVKSSMINSSNTPTHLKNMRVGRAFSVSNERFPLQKEHTSSNFLEESKLAPASLITLPKRSFSVEEYNRRNSLIATKIHYKENLDLI